jgi:hypothetical protein
MEPAIRFLRVVQCALLFSLIVVVSVPEFLQVRPAETPPRMAFYLIISLCVWMTVGMFFLRRKIVSKAERRMLVNPEDKAALNSWKAGHLIALACCEALALYGLVLRFLGFKLGQVVMFYLVGVGLMLYMTPRPPLNQA